MDIKWKKFSHGIGIKIIVFMIVILSFTMAITEFFIIIQEYSPSMIDEESYFDSDYYKGKIDKNLFDLTEIITKYKSEEYILKGNTVEEREMESKKEELLHEFLYSETVNEEASDLQKIELFNEMYEGKITAIKDELIQIDLDNYRGHLRDLQEAKGIIYYASDGVNIIKNTPDISKEYFQSFPVYTIMDSDGVGKKPEDTMIDGRYVDQLEKDTVIYYAMMNEHLNTEINDWQENKEIVVERFYKIMGFSILSLVALIYLILIIGRKSFDDEKVALQFIDKLFNDINIILCMSLILLWLNIITAMYYNVPYQVLFLITLCIASLGLTLVLSLCKHIKNNSLLKHTLLWKMILGINEIFINIAVLYKLMIVISMMTFINLLAVFGLDLYDLRLLIIWTIIFTSICTGLSLKKVKEFREIKSGVELIKNGKLDYNIQVKGNGEFGKLASNINTIAEGLQNSMNNELKSERLKTELITNVSHDIRTPLTSIITYVDLLKNEKDQNKVQQYISVLENKSLRLKSLTDDLFEASKVASGNMPVNFERINIISLINQGLGELNNKIEETQLDFKLNYHSEKLYVKADGKLLWRAIENVLSNIFKYALQDSRVYIDAVENDSEVRLSFKNISANELNISSDELMERFTRGDESRQGEGSGLGLSIAKSLINIQQGNFHIEIDGDLFKTMIILPKYKN